MTTAETTTSPDLLPPPQPAKAYLAARRITVLQISRDEGFSPHYCSRVLNGYAKPSRRFRSALSRRLGMPETELFRSAEESAAPVVAPEWEAKELTAQRRVALVRAERARRASPDDPALVRRVEECSVACAADPLAWTLVNVVLSAPPLTDEERRHIADLLHRRNAP